MRKRLAALAVAACALPAAAQPPAPPAAAPAPAANPFFEQWKTPFAMPPFDKIKAEHYLPAFDEAIRQRKAEIAAIDARKEAPSFADTIEALDRGGQLLEKVSSVFYSLSSADTNEQLQAIARQVSPKLAALRDDEALDAALFARVKAVWEQRAALKLDRERSKLLEETYKGFVRGGANLPPEKQTRLRAVNQELATLGVKFGDNLLKETNAFRLVIDKEADLAGLPPAVVAAAADAAKAAGQPGKWVFTLQAPSIWPFETFAANRELRRKLLEAYISRGDHDDAFDNKKVLSRIAALRAERANLLGYKTHADYILDENMAKTPAKVYDLLDQLWKPAIEVAKDEAAALQARIKAEGGDFKLEPWDWRYYAEKERKARYDLDDAALRPYFPLDQVRAGAFYAANRLYGVTFKERTDLPKYNPEVRTFEVRDKDGSFLGVYTADYHPRPGKRGGAWCGRLRGQRFVDGKDVRPIVTNVLNFTRPTQDAPALLSLEEVHTLFHEFGHALQGLFSKIHYGALDDMPRDFVELPSQIMEHWALQPEVLKVYAKHWKTGEPIPAELVEKIKKAGQFNQGFDTVEYLAASILDMDWHTIPAGEEPDAAAFERKSLERMGLIPEIVVRYRSPYFNHIFGGGSGYSAGYYSYIWADVLVCDAFKAFEEKGIFDQKTAASFRRNILEKPGTEEAMELYKRFRGREPSVQPLLEDRGLDKKTAR